MLNKLQLLILLPLLAFAGGAFAQSDLKVGYVNLERLLRDSSAAQAAQKKLEAEFAKRDQELAKMAEQIKRSQEALEKNAMTMTESERRGREREFGEINREFQRKQREFREDFNVRRQEELSALVDRANRVVRQIADAEKFDLILQEAVHVSPRLDLTDRVLKALDGTSPGKK
jgi:outer membrane protein